MHPAFASIDHQVPCPLVNQGILSRCCSISHQIPHKSTGNVWNRLFLQNPVTVGHAHFQSMFQMAIICNNSYFKDPCMHQNELSQ